MINLSEKITSLRKKQGWSQEQLAEKLSVSRQSVSKWESGQSLPEIDKILQMSKLFGVTTDELLKSEPTSAPGSGARSPETGAKAETEDDDRNSPKNDGNEPEDFASSEKSGYTPDDESIRARLSNARRQGWMTALATFLCVLCPVPLIVLAGVSDAGHFSENAAAGIGISVLLLLVSVAVVLFVYANGIGKELPLPANQPIRLPEPTEAELRRIYATHRRRQLLLTAFGTLLCVLSPLPLILSACLEAPDLTIVIMVGILLLLAAVAVFLFCFPLPSGKLLRHLLNCRTAEDLEDDAEDAADADFPGESSEEAKKYRSAQQLFSGLFWPLVTAAYLLVSFLSGAWHLTWIIWPVAACVSTAVVAFLRYRHRL